MSLQSVSLALPVLVASIGGAAALFVAAELAARWWLERQGRWSVWTPFSRTRLHLDPTVLPTLDPVAEHRINADGERGDPVPESPDDVFRVLVAGGSATECYYIDQERTWPHVVQETLNDPSSLQSLRARNVHVGNIARSLVTARHVDAILEKVLPRYDHLDAIVLMVGGSDVVNWLERRAPGTVEEPSIPPQALFAQHPEGPFGFGPRTLALRRIASSWRHRLLRPIERREGVGRRLDRAREMRRRAREILRETGDPQPMVDAFGRWFESLLDRARSKARHVIVVQQPWLEREFTPEEAKLCWSFGAGRPFTEEVESYFQNEVVWNVLRLVDDRADRIARQYGIERVLLQPLLDASFDDYYDEMHHTPRGCRKIGRAVALAILAAVEKQRAPAVPAALPSLPQVRPVPRRASA